MFNLIITIMKTNQLMKREFNGNQITQRTKDSFFNATELLSAYNNQNTKQKHMYHFWENQNTQQFIEVLDYDLNYNPQNSVHLKTHESTRGKGGGTWMHPYMFVKFAMWLSPEFELQIIKWVYDNLIEVRTQSGDYYKEMCEALLNNYTKIKGKKPNPFIYSNEAKFLNKLCYDSNEVGKRNELSEIELKLLNELQKLNIALISKGSLENSKRKELLAQHALNFKMINY